MRVEGVREEDPATSLFNVEEVEPPLTLRDFFLFKQKTFDFTKREVNRNSIRRSILGDRSGSRGGPDQLFMSASEEEHVASHEASREHIVFEEEEK